MSDADATPAPAGEAAADALGAAIVWLTRHHGQERSLAALMAGVDVAGRIEPAQAVAALEQAGYRAALLERKLADLPDALLPAVLLLAGGDCAVLVERTTEADGRRLCRLVLPGAAPQALEAQEGELAAEHAGLVIVATPTPEIAAPGAARGAAEVEPALRDPAEHWLWGTLKRFVPYYRASMVASALSNLLMLVTGLVTSVIYDKVIPQTATTTLWALATGGALALVFDFTARQLRAQLLDSAGRKADLIVGTTLFRQSLGARMEQRPASSGAYAHLIAQIEVVRDFFSSATLAAFSDLPFVVVFIAMTFVVGGPLGLVPLIAVPLLLASAALAQGTLRRATHAQLQQRGDLQGVLVEAVEGIEDIKATGAQARFLRHYEAASAQAALAQLRSRRAMSWSINFNAVAQQLITLVMLVWGVYLIQDKQITAGALMGAVMFAMRAVGPLSSVVMLATRYQGARAAMRALDAVMRQPLERDPARRYLAPRAGTGRLTLHDVGFAYPQPASVAGAVGGGLGPRVLQGVNLAFEPGERVAILGRIGSGKSTILRLLAGLYQPTDGQIAVDGIDLRQVDPVDHRARVGYVPQDARLFTGSLRDNVLLGRSAADASRLAEVARVTGLSRVVESHPQGWDLPVGDAGALLSGGQRQLVALARSLITQPRVVLMDEPTSSMDAQSEVAFLRQLVEATAGCTLVMVTHRPAVLELVQRIVVVDAGRVVMDGPKAQVMAVLSGQRPMPGTPGASPAAANVHRHPGTRPQEAKAAV